MWFWCDPDEAKEMMKRIDENTTENVRLSRETLATLCYLVELLQPRLANIAINVETIMPLDIGKTFIATVEGKDQFGNAFPIDFTANPPTWTLSDTTLATMTQDPTAGSEDVTGVAAGNETLSVTCAGLTASLAFVVEQAAPVLTSISISANPAV